MSGTDYTKTPNYGLYKSVSLADVDVWGDHLNANADVIDSTLHNLDGRAGVTSFNTRGGAVTLNSGDVTTALTFTPYNATNPAGYQTAAQVTTALSPYAPLVSPVFTGNPQAPTPAPGDADTSVATTAFVAAALGGVPGGAVINPTPPTGPAAGELWWDSTGGQLYVYYNDGNSSQWVTAANMEGLANAATKTDVAAAQNNVGRNLIHNPLFNVAQRGAGPFTAAGVYMLDRWANYIASDAASFVQFAVNDTDRAQIGDEAATWFLTNSFTGNAAATAANQVFQRIEGVRRLAGKTVTVSFYAKASAALKLGVSLDQSFGTGGSPSASLMGNGQTVQLSVAWQRISLSVALASAAGKTLGSNGDDSTTLNFWYSAGSSFNARSGSVGVQSGSIAIWGVQLEVGSVATPLEKLDPADDLRHCQRFYQTGTVGMVSNGTAGFSFGYTGQLQVLPRVTPTYAVSGGNLVNCSSPLIAPFGSSSSYQAIVTATTTATVNFYFNFSASADL